MVPTSSAPSFPPLGGSEVPPPTHKRENINMSQFSSNKNQTTPIHLPNKRSHGFHPTRTPEPPSVASPRSHGNLGGRNSLSVRFSRNEIQMDYYGLQYGLQQNSAPKNPPL